MLPLPYRLRLDKDIQRVLKSKAGAFDQVCGVKIAKNSLAISRFAVVVPNKVSKSAVRRNTLRRQYRDILYRWLPEMSPGFDVILLVSKPAVELDYTKKELQLRATLRRAKVL